MADVKIRNLEPYIIDAFKSRAKAAGRSLEAELRETLALVLSPSRKEMLDELASKRATIFERVMALSAKDEQLLPASTLESMRDAQQLWRKL